MDSQVVVADSIMGRMDSVSVVVSTIVTSQTISVSVSKTATIAITRITVGTSIKICGISFSFGISITAFTGTGNGNISSVNTGSGFNSVSVSAISMTKTVAISIVAIWGICVSIKNSGVSLGFSLGVDSSHKCGDNCNKGLHVASFCYEKLRGGGRGGGRSCSFN